MSVPEVDGQRRSAVPGQVGLAVIVFGIAVLVAWMLSIGPVPADPEGEPSSIPGGETAGPSRLAEDSAGAGAGSPLRTSVSLRPSESEVGFLVRVRDAQGAPVGGAAVHADEQRVTTDAEGLAPFGARPASVRVTHSDHGPWACDLRSVEGDGNVLDVALSPAAEVRFVVRDEVGRPLAGVEVVLARGAAPFDTTPPAFLETLRPTQRAGEVVYVAAGETADDGELLLRGLLPGEHTVYATRIGYVHAYDDGVSSFFTRRVSLRPGINHETLSMQTLYLQVLDVVNDTNVADADLRTLIGFSFTYPGFATDMQPDMARVSDVIRREVRAAFGLDELDYIGVARGTGAPDPAASGPVRVMLFPEGEWVPEVPWLRFEQLAVDVIPKVHVAHTYARGRLVVDTPYTVLARPLTDDGVPALMAFGFHPDLLLPRICAPSADSREESIQTTRSARPSASGHGERSESCPFDCGRRPR